MSESKDQNEAADGGSALTAELGASERRVVNLMASVLRANENTITPDALLIEDLWMDSLDHIEVVMAIEEHFDVEIPDEGFAGIKTVQEVFDLVNRVVPNACGEPGLTEPGKD